MYAAPFRSTQVITTTRPKQNAKKTAIRATATVMSNRGPVILEHSTDPKSISQDAGRSGGGQRSGVWSAAEWKPPREPVVLRTGM
ncbi:MAG: hypothetical protein OHK0028_00560 [Deltaproteobacteria bacterium]